MRISTKGRYAVRLMLELALKSTGEPIRLKDVASSQDISEKYLEQIIAVLNKAGFVRSVRGREGGYILARRPEEYTVGMILRLTEGDLSPVECVENTTGCDRAESCVTRMLWKKLGAAINEVVDAITLEDLISWEKEKISDYVI